MCIYASLRSFRFVSILDSSFASFALGSGFWKLCDSASSLDIDLVQREARGTPPLSYDAFSRSLFLVPYIHICSLVQALAIKTSLHCFFLDTPTKKKD